jgi:hypothetical protein
MTVKRILSARALRALSQGKYSDSLHTFLVNTDARLDRLELLMNEQVAREIAERTAAYHNTYDGINVIQTRDAYDIHTACVLANEIKAKYNVHEVTFDPGPHDVTGTRQTTAADAVKMVNVTPTAVNLFAYTLVLTHAGVVYSFAYTGDATCTVAEITAGFVALINTAMPASTVVAVDNITAFSLEAEVTDENFTVVYSANLAEADDVTTLDTLLDEIKADFNVHLTDAGVHLNNDTTSTIAGSTDATTAGALLVVNEAKAALNAHVANSRGINVELTNSAQEVILA